MLGQYKDEKDPKKKRNILDKMKAGTVRLKKVRANLADIEREYINRASYDTSYSESVDEKMDLNDPMLVRLRAAQIKRNQQAADRLKKAKSDKEKEKAEKLAARNATKIKALKKKRAEVMRDMEQEAEPEGGKIADRYGRILNKIDNDIIKLGGNPMTNEEKINLFVEENVPTNPSKWAYYKAQAKKKFDVYPSAYANGWAAKKYKAAGGGWRKEK
jgi:hypothetical protein